MAQNEAKYTHIAFQLVVVVARKVRLQEVSHSCEVPHKLTIMLSPRKALGDLRKISKVVSHEEEGIQVGLQIVLY